MYTFTLNDTKLDFETSEEVFYPTATSELLIAGIRSFSKGPKKILDLGCGSGLVGIVLAKDGLASNPVYASDLSKEAVKLAAQNAKIHQCGMLAKDGSVFEPWAGEKFDYIIDDISGVAEEAARISPWFPPNVPCGSGPDGTKLVCEVIQQSPRFLNAQGVLFFPILSLSNKEKILKAAQEIFPRVKQLIHKDFILPPQMQEKISLLKRLQSEGKIQFEEKFGLLLWSIEIYAATMVD